MSSPGSLLYGCIIHHSRPDVTIIAVRTVKAGRIKRRSLVVGIMICGEFVISRLSALSTAVVSAG